MEQNDDFLVLRGFMFTELQLKGAELVVYGLIYNFSHDGVHKFYGSLNYIAERYALEKSSVFRAINRLVEKGLVVKETKNVEGVMVCEYSVTRRVEKCEDCMQNAYTPRMQNAYDPVCKTPTPPVCKTPTNKYNIVKDNIKDNIKILDSKSSKLDLLSSKRDDKPDRSAVNQVPDTGDFLEGRRSSSRPTLKITKSTKPEDFGMTAVDFDSIKVGDFKRLVNYFEYNRRDKTGKVIAPYTKPTYKTRVEDLIRFTHGHWKMACDAINAAIDHNWQGFSDGNGLYWKKTLDEYRDEENFENSFNGAEHAMPEYLRQIKKL